MRPALISTQNMPYRVALYNWLVARGVRVILISDGAFCDGLDAMVELVPAIRMCGLLWPKHHLNTDTAAPSVVFFDLRLLPWVLLRKSLKRTAFWGIGAGRRKIFNVLRKAVLRRSYGFLSYMPRGQSIVPHDRARNSIAVINSVFIGPVENGWAESNRLVFLGTLDGRKRLDVLIKALRILRDQGQHWELAIAGDGPEREPLERQIASLGLQASVRFAGALNTDQEKSELFTGAFLTILPGQAGLSVLESCAYGVPVLTYEQAITGGERDVIIDGKTGFFYAKQTPDCLAGKIKVLSENPQRVRDISQRAHTYFHTKASGEHMAQRMLRYLRAMP